MAEDEFPTAEGSLPAEIQKFIKMADSNLDGFWSSMNSDDPELRLSDACGTWGTYPSVKKMLIGKLNCFAFEEAFQAVISRLHYKLDRNHELATDILMSRAEESGLNSALIWKAGKYCRDLLADPQCKYFRNTTDDTFPGCFGESLYEMPADIREAIMDGHAELLCLNAKISKKSSPDAPLHGGRENEAGAPVMGVSLFDAACIANEEDKEAARIAKKNWQNSRNPKLPEPIGISSQHSQTELYDISELLKFIAIVEGQHIALQCRKSLRSKLCSVRKPMKDNDCKPSEPSEPPAK